MGSQRRQNKRAPRTRGPESLVLGSIEGDERPRDLQRRQGCRSTPNRYTWLREQTKSTRRKGCSNQHYLPVLSFLRPFSRVYTPLIRISALSRVSSPCFYYYVSPPCSFVRATIKESVLRERRATDPQSFGYTV